MPKYKFMRAYEAWGNDRDAATVPGGIRGLRGTRAVWATVGSGGVQRKPASDALILHHLERFQTITSVDRAPGPDAPVGAVEIRYANGTSEVVPQGDLVCVEFPDA